MLTKLILVFYLFHLIMSQVYAIRRVDDDPEQSRNTRRRTREHNWIDAQSQEGASSSNTVSYANPEESIINNYPYPIIDTHHGLHQTDYEQSTYNAAPVYTYQYGEPSYSAQDNLLDFNWNSAPGTSDVQNQKENYNAPLQSNYEPNLSYDNIGNPLYTSTNANLENFHQDIHWNSYPIACNDNYEQQLDRENYDFVRGSSLNDFNQDLGEFADQELFDYTNDENVPDQYCIECNQNIGKSEDVLLLHTMKCKEISKRKKKSYGCYACTYNTYRCDHMKIHIRSHSGYRPYKCHLCSFAGADSRNIDSHMRANHGNVLHLVHDQICIECNKNIGNNKDQLLQHIVICKEIAKRKKTCYGCYGCGYDTNRRDDIKSHIQQHFGYPSYKCNHCSFTSTQDECIASHVRANHPPPVFTIQDQICSQCNENLGTNEDNIVQHTKSCKEIEKRKKKRYGCYQCDHDTEKSDPMKRHIRIHTGYKPFSCHLCDFATKEQKNIRIHLKRIHDIEMG